MILKRVKLYLLNYWALQLEGGDYTPLSGFKELEMGIMMARRRAKYEMDEASKKRAEKKMAAREAGKKRGPGRPPKPKAEAKPEVKSGPNGQGKA
jgi:DNA invertase Pin-like site-specific DNA recombinase